MAKMFYTIDETKTALGRNEEEIKQLTREGRLREFRDGPRLMYKADQVEQLKAEISPGGGDVISLAPQGDSGAPIGMAGDSRSGTGSGIALGDSSGGRKEDTHLDLSSSGSLGASGSFSGSGSLSGIPSPGRAVPGDSRSGAPGTGSGILNLGSSGTGSGMNAGGGSGGTRAGGITVFDVDEDKRADPSAQTAMGPAGEQQVSLEGVGSGSGLLDLTREKDDTSLGAVFDELTPGASGASGRRQAMSSGGSAAALETQAGDVAAVTVERGARATLAAPIFIEAADPWAVALGAASLATTGILLFAGFVLGAALLGYRPEILTTINQSQMMWLGIALGVQVIALGAGFFVGKSGAK
jgi:hypothetical protein